MSKGIITCYLNREDYEGDYERDLLDSVCSVNKESLEVVRKSGFPIMFVTTIGEATRTEKIDYDKQFPVYPPKQKTTQELEEEAEEQKQKRRERLGKTTKEVAKEEEKKIDII